MYSRKLLLAACITLLFNVTMLSANEQKEEVIDTQKHSYFTKTNVFIGVLMTAVIIEAWYIFTLRSQLWSQIDDDPLHANIILLDADIKQFRQDLAKANHRNDETPHASIFYARTLDLQTLTQRLAWIKSLYQDVTHKTDDQIKADEAPLRKKFITDLPPKHTWMQVDIQKGITHKLIVHYITEIEKTSQDDSHLKSINTMYLEALHIKHNK